MDETRWTAGPWVVQPDYGSGETFVVAGAWPLGSTICVVDQNDRTANARLIAAAPDLYAALKAFMSADGHDDFTDEWPAARAAIDKAEGR